MDTEEAWQQFRKNTAVQEDTTIQKSVDDNNTQNLRGMLDTILAQQNEILTNTKRTAELVPKILGDEGAIDNATEEAGLQQQAMSQMGGGMPMGGEPMGGMPGGDMSQAGMGGEAPMGRESPEAGESEGQEDDEMSEDELAEILNGNAETETHEGAEAGAVEGEVPETPEEIAEEVEGAEEGLEDEAVEEDLEGEDVEGEGDEYISDEAPVGEEEFGEEEIAVDDPIARILQVIDDEAHAAIDEDRPEDVEAIMDAKRAVEAFVKSASCDKVEKSEEISTQNVEASCDKTPEDALSTKTGKEKTAPVKASEEPQVAEESEEAAEPTVSEKKSASPTIPSFRDMVDFHTQNPLANVWDAGVAVHKSMTEKAPVVAEGEVAVEPEEEVEVTETPAEETVEKEAVEEDTDDEIEALLEPILEYCEANGLTVEDLSAMSDEELAQVIAMALDKGDEEPDGDEVPEDVPEADPIAEDTEEIGKSENGIQQAGCPCEGLNGEDRIEKDSVASASVINETPSKNDTGTSHSVEGVMPSSGTHDPNAIASAKPTTGPLKTGLNVMKSEGKHIMSMRELMDRNVKKSQSARPDSVCSTNGDLSRPELSTTMKSAGSASAKPQTRDLKGFVESAKNGMQTYMEAITAQRENRI